MHASEFIISLMKHFEGFTPVIKSDAGHPCIGYGCDLTAKEAAKYKDREITEQEADALMRLKTATVESAINKSVMVPLAQNRFDALVSLTYNIGVSAFESSTLLSMLNGARYQDAAEQFGRWVHSGGKVLPGLVERRREEAALFSDK